MRLRAGIVFLIGICAMSVAGGCSEHSPKTINVDGHSFKVPSENLIEERIPWLPQSKEKGLLFVVNPNEPVQDRISVLIESSGVTCPSNRDLGSTPLASACQAAERGESAFAGQGYQPRKVFRYPGDPTQWEYRTGDGRGQGTVVATCSAMSDGNGLCHSLNAYGDLIYSVGFRDSEIVRLPEIWARVDELLLSWEVNDNAG